MAGDHPVPETLETIAEKLTALGKTIEQQFTKVDERFAQVDARFGQADARLTSIDEQLADLRKDLGSRIDETKLHLSVKIEAVDAKVQLAYEAIVALNDAKAANDADHKAFRSQLSDHDVRILALEPRKTSRS